jgi:hypothetical protein
MYEPWTLGKNALWLRASPFLSTIPSKRDLLLRYGLIPLTVLLPAATRMPSILKDLTTCLSAIRNTNISCVA